MHKIGGKKILFVCDWNFSYLFSKVAFWFEDKGYICDTTIVTGKIYYDKLRSGVTPAPFKYHYLTQDASDDPHPEKWFDARKAALYEKKYGIPTLWIYAWADRGFVHDTYKKNVGRMIRLFELFEEVFEKHQPDLIVTNAYASMIHLILYAVATQKGITCIKPTWTRLSKQQFFSLTPYDDVIEWNIPDEKYRKKISGFVDHFRKHAKQREHYVVDSGASNTQTLDEEKFLVMLWLGCRYIRRYYISKAYRGDHTKPAPHIMIGRKITAKWRKLYTKLFLRYDPIEEGEKYVYYPLQLQPESSTMTQAPFYLNQISTLEALSKSVPSDTIIIVKEHPHIIGYRGLAYYKEIRKFSNVKFVNPKLDTLTLARKSIFVFSLTGTACLEALLLGVPSVMCGRSYFENHPGICNLYDVAITKRHKTIYEYIDTFKYDKAAVIDLMTKVMGNAFDMKLVEPGDYSNSPILQKDNIDAVCEALYHIVTTLEK